MSSTAIPEDRKESLLALLPSVNSGIVDLQALIDADELSLEQRKNVRVISELLRQAANHCEAIAYTPEEKKRQKKKRRKAKQARIKKAQPQSRSVFTVGPRGGVGGFATRNDGHRR